MPGFDEAQGPSGAAATRVAELSRYLFSAGFLIAEIWLLANLVSPLALVAMFSVSLLLVLLARIVPASLESSYIIAVFVGFFAFVYFLGDIVEGLRALVSTRDESLPATAIALGASYCYLRTVYAVREPSVSLWDFARYYFFAPTFFIGPIMTPVYFARQTSRASWSDATAGAAMVAFGLGRFALSGILAQVIPQSSADHMSLAAALQSPAEIWVGSALAGVWLYLNFSGISLVAIGAARIMGIVVPQNFDNPFIATSLTEFWRRWHITLGDWLRVNVFNPVARTLRTRGFGWAAFVIPALGTMVLCGLWHEVNISFIIWGTLHGIGLAVNGVWTQFVTMRFSEPIRKSLAYQTVSWFLTQAYVVFTWSFFFPLPSSLEISGRYALSMLMLR